MKKFHPREIPEGYEQVIRGKTQEGDLLWNGLRGGWNPAYWMQQRRKVGEFFAVARKKEPES